MSVTIRFSCCGCDAVEEVRPNAEREFIFGGDSGWNRIVKPSIQETAPEGWVAFDPYTLLCYCPNCWREIASDEVEPVLSNPGEGG